MKIFRFEDLDCWKEARALVQSVYEAARNKDFSKDLRFSGQIQSAAISSMANIAENFVRRPMKEFTQFIY